jgi:hypothetical protein
VFAANPRTSENAVPHGRLGLTIFWKAPAMVDSPQFLLKAMFDAAISAALPEKIVPRRLPAPPKGRTIVVGAGKASAAMAKARQRIPSRTRRVMPPLSAFWNWWRALGRMIWCCA